MKQGEGKNSLGERPCDLWQPLEQSTLHALPLLIFPVILEAAGGRGQKLGQVESQLIVYITVLFVKVLAI